jgi:hypothetical protein
VDWAVVVRFPRDLSIRSISNPSFQNLVVVIYVVFAVFVTLFPNGPDSRQFLVSLTDAPKNMAETFGLSDPGSYLNAALELENLNEITVHQVWVTNLWPPGMLVLNAVLLRFFGDSFGLAFAVFTMLIWSTLISLFALKLRVRFGVNGALLLSTLLIISPPIQSWILGYGLFYAEGISVAAFLVGSICLLEMSRQIKYLNSMHWGILAGIFFSIAAYFRTTFSNIQFALLGSAGIATVVLVAALLSKKSNRLVALVKVQVSGIITSWIVLLSLMEPWLQFKNTRDWSIVGDMFFRGVWRERSTLPDFAISAGWGCEINEEFCKEVQDYESVTGALFPIEEMRSETFLTAIFNPIEYVQDRFTFISESWFFGPTSADPKFVGLIILFLFGWTLAVLVGSVMKFEFSSLAIFLSILLLAAPLMIGHIEPRYLIPLQISFFLLPWMISERSSPKQDVSIEKRENSGYRETLTTEERENRG